MLKASRSQAPPPATAATPRARQGQQRTTAQIVVYDLLRIAARIFVVVALRMRCKGREHIPAEGPVLVCSNHQSSLDPPLVGLAFDRRLNYLARQGLFEIPVLRSIIKFLDAIPIDREGTGLAGLKETLRRLKRGEIVLVFPEGTRTETGRVQPLKPGVIAVARRSRAPLLPVGLDGAFDVLPRGSVVPRLATVHLVIGEAISPELVESLDDTALLAELEHRIRACHAAARAGRLR